MKEWPGITVMSALATGALMATVAAAAAGTAGAASEVTFTADVAPIVFAKCASCHRPGEAAPFSLLTYDDLRRRGRLIASVVTAKTMPPWKAASEDYEYRDDRRLTAAQIATIQQWVESGMSEGDPAKLPARPVFTDGWRLGTPDLVVSMPEPFAVPADGPDVYRNFVLPLNQAVDRWVRAVEYRPSARTVVHHSLFYVDGTGGARAQDARDAVPGFAGAMGGFAGARAGLMRMVMQGGGGGRLAGAQGVPDAARDAERAITALGGYALGAQPHALPDGLSYFVPKGSDLVLSTHFHPSGKVEKEASTVGIYFAAAPPTQAFTGILLPPVFGVFEGIDIPAGEKGYTVKDSWTLPIDVKAFNVGAHAHYLAKSMLLTATLPDGSVKTLLRIADWDFAWQDQYQFKEAVALPKGTRLDTTIVYDNSADNPRNPTRPPVRVNWGEQSTDEMGATGIQVVAANPDELPQLQAAYAAHVRQAALTRPGLGQLIRQRMQR